MSINTIKFPQVISFVDHSGMTYTNVTTGESVVPTASIETSPSQILSYTDVNWITPPVAGDFVQAKYDASIGNYEEDGFEGAEALPSITFDDFPIGWRSDLDVPPPGWSLFNAGSHDATNHVVREANGLRLTYSGGTDIGLVLDHITIPLGNDYQIIFDYSVRVSGNIQVRTGIISTALVANIDTPTTLIRASTGIDNFTITRNNTPTDDTLRSLSIKAITNKLQSFTLDLKNCLG